MSLKKRIDTYLKNYLKKNIGEEEYEKRVLEATKSKKKSKFAQKMERGNWKYWKYLYIILIIACSGMFFFKLIPIDTYMDNTESVTISSISSIKQNKNFMLWAEKVTFKGIINKEEKYFVEYFYPNKMYHSGDFSKTILTTLINKDNLKKQGAKENPIQFVYINPVKRDRDVLVSFMKDNIQQYLMFNKRYYGICLMDLIYYGFWLWVVWGVSYLFYVYILKENFNLDEFN